MSKVRQIVKDGLKCDALVYQWTVIDVEDGVLPSDASPEVIHQTLTDTEIISDAENRLDICEDDMNQEDKRYRREAIQLRKFLNKWR